MKRSYVLVCVLVMISSLLAACQQSESTDAEDGASPFSVAINDISIDDDRYVVDFEASGFTPCPDTEDCTHLHVFFNDVAPEDAVVPAEGPWELYYGPSPYDGYRVADRPAGATEICMLVANADHSGYPQDADCFDLP